MAKNFKDVDKGWKKFKRKWLKQVALNKVAKSGIQAPEANKEHESESFTGKSFIGFGGAKKKIDMVTLGGIHEIGAPGANIPSRSFIRSTFDENRKKYERLLIKKGQEIFIGKRTLEGSLNLVGEQYRKDVVTKMGRGQITPKLKAATIKARGDSVPLVDTGALRDSLTTKVGPKPNN